MLNRMFQFLALAGVVLLTGCFTPSPLAKASARSHLRPVVAAIESFKAGAGRVPDSLEELQSRQQAKLVLAESTEDGGVWSIVYKKKAPTSYEVSFHHVHYDLYYEDGKEVGWGFNPWR